MQYMTLLNEEGRIRQYSLDTHPGEGVVIVDFPDDFDFGTVDQYRVVDGALSHDPLPGDPGPEAAAYTQQERNDFIEGLMEGLGNEQ